MIVDKDIIVRAVLGIVLFVISVKVVGPVIFEILKGKIPGTQNPENDIDSMIRRQKERLRAQYGIAERTDHLISQTHQSETSSELPPRISHSTTKEVEELFKETRWGGGDFVKKMQNEIAKNYSYTLAESKVNAFVLLAEKRKFISYLSIDNQKSLEAVKNYLSMLMLLLILIDEIRNKEYNLLERVAKKCRVDTMELLLALQIKILQSIATKKAIKEERLFENTPTLHQYSEETMKDSLDSILRKEANLWAKGHSLFFEELSIYLNYADLLIPLPALQSKKDLNTAYDILKISPDLELDEIKKAYKKLAMLRHPDKIGQLNLPKTLEKKALSKFNYIQEAYDIIIAERKK